MSDKEIVAEKTGNVTTFRRKGSDMNPDMTVEETKEWVESYLDCMEAHMIDKSKWSDMEEVVACPEESEYIPVLLDLFKEGKGLNNSVKLSYAIDELRRTEEYEITDDFLLKRIKSR